MLQRKYILVFRQTCFVQEFEILGPCEEVLLRLRGSPTDLKVSGLLLRGWICES